MPISEIAVAYLWFVLIATFALMVVRAIGDQKLRDNFRDIKKNRSERYPQRPLERDFSRVEPRISLLLRSGFRSAQVTIRHEDSKRYLEFKKYIRGVGDYGIELVLPSYKWAREYLPRVQAYCDENEISYRIRPKCKPRSREVLSVDCGRDPETAHALARKVWFEIFGLPKEAFFDVSAHGISPYGETVDHPDREPMTFGRWWRQTFRNSEDPSLRSPTGCVIKLLWVISMWVVFFGLLISVIGSHGEPADWSLSLAGATLSGSTAGLIFLCLYLTNVALVLLHDFPKQQTIITWLPVVERVWRWIVRVTLPIAVIMVWTGA